MKLKIVVLILLPLLIMAVDLNDDAYIWTQDQGFFTLYRQIWVRALDVDGDVVIWSKEVELPSRDLIFDPFHHSLIATFNDFDGTLQEHILAESLFIKDSLSAAWQETETPVLGNTANSFSYHERSATQVVIVAATPTGVKYSPNGGEAWSAVSPPLNANAYDAILSPVNQTGTLFNMTYFAAHPGGVSSKAGFPPTAAWVLLPGNVESQDFENSDPGNLDLLPPGWIQSGEDEEYNYVRIDTTVANSGVYSLLIYSSTVGGLEVAARYEIPDLNFVICKFQFMPSYHSGVIEFKNSLSLKIAYRYGVMSYYTPDDGWVEIEESGVNPLVFNEIGVTLDFENGSGILITPNSVDTVELYEAEDEVAEVVFSTETFGSGSSPYWIDDFSAQSRVFTLAPHSDDLNYVHAGTSAGVYYFDGSDWTKSIDIADDWYILETDLEGNYLVAVSPNLVYISDDQGANWNDITGDIPDINDIYVDINGVVYAATDSFPYKYDGSWSQMSNGFLENGVMTQVKSCHAITMIEPDTIIVGNDNGIYVSVDGGNNWFENNTGLEPYPIPNSVIDEVDEYFEDAVPSDPSRGVLELLTDEIGPIPDVDGDGLLHVVVLDIYEDGGDNSASYFDSNNEDTLDENSNGMELVYVDVDFWQTDVNATKTSISRDVGAMIEYAYDPEEDDWMVIGFERYAAYLNNLGAGAVDTSGIPLLPNNLTFAEAAEQQEYLWIQYLKDKLGVAILDDFNLAEGSFVDPQSGISTIRKLQGIEAIDSILVGRTPGSFVDAFADWAVSCYLDNLISVKNIVSSFTIVASTGGRRESQQFFSAEAYKVNDPTNPLIFSGNDNNDFHLHVIEYDGVDTTIHPIADSNFDNPDRNVHRINMSNPFDLLVEVISSRGIDPAEAFYNLGRDLVVDTLDMIGILQAPLADRFMRVFYYTHDRRYLDAGEEGVYLNYDEESIELALLNPDSPEGFRIYYADISLPPVDGTMTLSFLSEDVSGFEHTPSYSVSVKSIGIEGGYIATADKSFRVDIPRNALDKTYHITACNTGKSFYVGPNTSLNVDAVLTIDVSSIESNELSIYRKDGENWIEIQCDRIGDKLEAEINKLGEFKVMEGNLVIDIPETLELSTNTISPFDINYAIPVRSNMRIDVYNALGQRVKTLVKGTKEPGFYTIRWDSRSDNGDLVGNGIYFYRLSAAGENLTKKIVVVR